VSGANAAVTFGGLHFANPPYAVRDGTGRLYSAAVCFTPVP
jgi:hypothetical protein